MYHESELLTQFHKVCWNAEILALKSLHDIEIPLCGHLNELTSSDCLKLIVSIFNLMCSISGNRLKQLLLLKMVASGDLK